MNEEGTTFDDATVRIVNWIIIYSCNLIVPGLFSLAVLSNGGECGIGIAIILIGFLGLFCVKQFPRFARRLLVGGMMVAFMSMLPILQIAAGGFALCIWQDITGNFGGIKTALGKDRVTKEIGGFAVTILTAQPLLLVSFLLGSLGCWISGPRVDPQAAVEENHEDESLE